MTTDLFNRLSAVPQAPRYGANVQTLPPTAVVDRIYNLGGLT
jgi:hypothetical protein